MNTLAWNNGIFADGFSRSAKWAVMSLGEYVLSFTRLGETSEDSFIMVLVKKKLSAASGFGFVSYAILSAFLCYFAMYAFRKPFGAATFEGEMWFGMNVGLKDAIGAWQLVGYAISKLLGIKFCSEIKGHRREKMLIFLIVISELALLGYGVVSNDFKFIAIALNGLAHGMVWCGG